MNSHPKRREEDEELAPLAEFAGENTARYRERFARLEAGDAGVFEFNPAALVFGPFWAAARGMWELAWGLLILHAVALMLFIGGLARDNPAMGAGILLSPAAALVFGALADRIYFWRFNRWRTNPQISSGFSRGRAFWCGCAALAFWPLLAYRSSQEAPGARECLRMWRKISRGGDAEFSERFNCLVLSDAPSAKKAADAVAKSIDNGVDFLTVRFAGFFDAITAGVRAILNGLEAVFVGTPWPLTALALGLLAWRAAGKTVGIFMIGALLYISFFGFWNAAMSTMSLVGASSFLCVLLGAPLGVWCAKRPRAYRVARPVLDVMQTMPSFVYLIPAIAFFFHRQAPGDFGDGDFRHAADDSADRAGNHAGAFLSARGRAGFRGDARAIAVQGGAAAGAAVHYGGDQPDHYDVSFNGGDSGADWRGRAGV